MEKEFHESVLYPKYQIEFPRKAAHWLTNTYFTAVEPHSNEVSTQQEILGACDEFEQSMSNDGGHSENDQDPKSSPQVQFSMQRNSNQHNDDFFISMPTTTHTIRKINAGDLCRLLESKTSYTQPSDERIPYSVNIWDHGGQNEFIITNQLFLSVEALNLIVMDISLDLNMTLKQSSETKGKFGIPKTPAQILCYWLNALHLRAMERRSKPNISLVLTHNDMIQGDDQKKYTDSYIEELFKCIRGKPYEPYIRIRNIFVVDNKKGTEDDFAKIRNRIFAQITGQTTWGIERPTRWLKLEADILEKAQQIKKPYLHISTVNDLASAFAMDEKELDSCLRFHHILGDLIYYPDKKLSDFLVTNPQWLLNMFKTLITAHAFLKSRQLRPEIIMN